MNTYAKRGTVHLPVRLWPEGDRVAWERNCAPGDPFDDPGYGACLRGPTREFYSMGYGAWLCFLANRGSLDPLVPPLERVTRRRLRAYFRMLQRAGYANSTIAARFTALTYALKILVPGADVSWVQRPDGVRISALLEQQQRPFIVPDSGVLFRWAMEMMDTAASASNYQDGLLLAVFASRGRRLRSMALLRIGQEFLECGDGYRIELAPEQVKTHKADHFNLPHELTLYIRHYLAEIRPALLGHESHDALWIGHRGAPWTAQGIKARVRKLTRQRFGQSFGPHRFRHAIATTATLREPTSPGLAAGLLGIQAKSSRSITTGPDKARQLPTSIELSPPGVNAYR